MISELLLNWKMNIPDTRFDEYMKIISQYLSRPDSSLKRIHLSSPTPYLKTLTSYSSDKLRIGSQDIHFESEGAYSGGVSAKIVADCGASFTLIGHSETRDGLSKQQIKQKINNALRCGLDVYFCFGEHTQIQDVSKRMIQITEQLNVLNEFVKTYGVKIKLCYEPVWSIGTGIIPSATDVQFVVDGVKSSNLFQQLQIFYGGSVRPENMTEFRNVSGLHGLLVGGASLKLSKLIKML